jgi:GWxTD domain-containing protein
MKRLQILMVILILLAPVLTAQSDRQRQEEEEDYYKKWLSEDVRYIITEDEKSVMEGLSTPEEKEQFVEQFWYRRDPDPRTATNEFKEEHYRRIAYANERFQSGKPGWMTDRGRVYIIHGPPTEITSYPSGGNYVRKAHEGGGETSTFPFEVWRYHHIEGLQGNEGEFELEFVDPSWSGEYHLSMNPDEKDALMRVPGLGLTAAERMGRASKTQRPFFQPGMRERYPMMPLRAIDNPFIRYENMVRAQQAQPLKYADLKEAVQVDISYDQLPVKIREDYFALDDRRVLVPVTAEIDNKDLDFKEEMGARRAKVAVYGIVTSITNRFITEFDDDLVLAYPPAAFEKALTSRSSYQHMLLLDRNMRYKLDLVVKDLNSGDVGVAQRGLTPPKYDSEELSASSLIVSDLIVPLKDIPEQGEMFVLGDVKVRPSVTNRFLLENPLGLYMQLYGLNIDQQTWVPAVETRYGIFREGRPVLEVVGGERESLRIYSDGRAALIKVLPTDTLEPGRYRIEVSVTDKINGKSVLRRETIDLVSSKTQVAALER